MSKFKYYTVKNDYINALKEVDCNVTNGLQHNNTYKNNRPYIGVLFEINGIKYIAPLTSDKNQKLINKNINNITFHPIVDSYGNYLGSININNMIPVKNSNIEKVVFKDIKDKKYLSLIDKQLKLLNKDFDKIIKKSEKLYKIMTTENSAKIKFESYCLDFKKLENVCKNYK